MSAPARALEVRGGPFLHADRTTRALMWEVVAALLPVVGVAVYFFGPVALWSCGACVAGALSTERLVGGQYGARSLRDGSALITGLLLALTLPPSLPLWMAFAGGVMAVGVGKALFGGLGHNPFNPALVGRALLQACFPGELTTWTAPHADWAELGARVLAWPSSAGAPVDAVTSATPLGLAKFEGTLTRLEPLLWGNVSGSLGETSALLLLAIGVWLGLRRVFDYRLPLATLLSVALFGGLLHLLLPTRCPPPAFMLLSGGLAFAAVFMVTDPVTTPTTPRGAWLFGLGVGVLVVAIRAFGGLPEGVMYAVLLMNAATPLIDGVTQPAPFGANVRL